MAFFWHTVALTCINIFPILGYNLVFGKGKILHFGQEAVSLTLAYVFWTLAMRFQVPLPLALLAGAAAMIVLAVLFTRMSLRLSPDALGVLTIALHLMALTIVLNWQSVTRGALGIPAIPRAPFPHTLEGFGLLCLALVALWTFFLWRLDRSRFGRALAALSEHPWHAQAAGVDRARVHLIAFLVAGGGSMISTFLYPPYLSLLTPSDFGFPMMIFFIMCVVAGGPGNLFGVLLATVALSFLKEGIRFVHLPADLIGPVRLILFGVILFVAVWMRRDRVFPKQRTV